MCCAGGLATNTVQRLCSHQTSSATRCSPPCGLEQSGKFRRLSCAWVLCTSSSNRSTSCPYSPGGQWNVFASKVTSAKVSAIPRLIMASPSSPAIFSRKLVFRSPTRTLECRIAPPDSAVNRERRSVDGRRCNSIKIQGQGQAPFAQTHPSAHCHVVQRATWPLKFTGGAFAPGWHHTVQQNKAPQKTVVESRQRVTPKRESSGGRIDFTQIRE